MPRWYSPALMAALFAGAAVVFAASALVWAPDLLLDGKSLNQGDARLEKARNDVRTAAIQFLGVLGLAIGAFLTLRTVKVTREGQIVDRFTNAVDQIGNHESLAARVGGVYALEQVAQQQPAEHAAVVEVLRGLVRTATPVGSRDEHSPGGGPPPDAEAALAVLSRRDASRDVEGRALVFRGVDLRCADVRKSPLAGVRIRASRLDGVTLRNVDLSGAELSGVQAPGADFTDANLASASFDRCALQGAHLWSIGHVSFLDCDLEGADIDLNPSSDATYTGKTVANVGFSDLCGARWRPGSTFRDSVFTETDLSGAHLGGVEFDGVQLRFTTLRGAWLGDADLSGAVLTGVDLLGAHAQEGVRWPEGFKPADERFGEPIPLDQFVDGRRDLRGVSVVYEKEMRRLGDLAGADLRGASLHGLVPGLDLRHALLRGASIRSYEPVPNVTLAGADLRGANLMDSNLQIVDLREADLRGARLQNNDFSKAKLEGAQLTGARANRETRWPPGVDPVEAGVTVTWY